MATPLSPQFTDTAIGADDPTRVFRAPQMAAAPVKPAAVAPPAVDLPKLALRYQDAMTALTFAFACAFLSFAAPIDAAIWLNLLPGIIGAVALARVVAMSMPMWQVAVAAVLCFVPWFSTAWYIAIVTQSVRPIRTAGGTVGPFSATLPGASGLRRHLRTAAMLTFLAASLGTLGAHYHFEQQAERLAWQPQYAGDLSIDLPGAWERDTMRPGTAVTDKRRYALVVAVNLGAAESAPTLDAAKTAFTPEEAKVDWQESSKESHGGAQWQVARGAMVEGGTDYKVSMWLGHTQDGRVGVVLAKVRQDASAAVAEVAERVAQSAKFAPSKAQPVAAVAPAPAPVAAPTPVPAVAPTHEETGAGVALTVPDSWERIADKTSVMVSSPDHTCVVAAQGGSKSVITREFSKMQRDLVHTLAGARPGPVEQSDAGGIHVASRRYTGQLNGLPRTAVLSTLATADGRNVLLFTLTTDGGPKDVADAAAEVTRSVRWTGLEAAAKVANVARHK